MQIFELIPLNGSRRISDFIVETLYNMAGGTKSLSGMKLVNGIFQQRHLSFNFLLRQLIDILLPLFSLSVSLFLRCPIKSVSSSFLCGSQRLVWRTMQHSVSLSFLLFHQRDLSLWCFNQATHTCRASPLYMFAQIACLWHDSLFTLVELCKIFACVELN